ncbi:hypothetical protein [Curtobacterium sp. MCSS17_016]|uniref:hypothetical protein n=1 Tax=Curtobacterium sp. MCSS17_016 TaxID=2175644 RepID=UPI000DAA027C|nr:hypothetical protein [Curtobacterium sp. MCSS17_016]WIE81309.1 hypothetical protein DEJ19_018925 [Curtobacterium sp. MCSS17_016]
MTTKWADVAARLGRNDYPVALANAVGTQQLTDTAEIAAGLEAAWTMAEWPARTLSTDLWLTLFGTVLDNGEYLNHTTPATTAELPELITLYRGATDETSRGMSWTDNLEQAQWFATRLTNIGYPGARVYEIGALNTMVLARFHSRGEDEWVLDPTMFEPDDVVPRHPIR